MKYLIRFIPVENGTEVDLGELGIVTNVHYYMRERPHKLLGFRPTPGKKIAGHLVVAIALEGKQRSKAPRRLRPLADAPAVIAAVG